MECAIVLFNRDLRVRDHPALHGALAAATRVVPLFVFERALVAGCPNRASFLLDCLTDLEAQLRQRGGDLLVTEGDPVTETMRVAHIHGARAVFTSSDVTRHAQQRESRLAEACADARLAWRPSPGVTVVPPGELHPAGSEHYRVFTPYWRAWRTTSRRTPLRAPHRIDVPESLRADPLPAAATIVGAGRSPELPIGGESAARRRLRAWIASGADRYGDRQDALASDATSRLSPYLHFGCLSPLELAERFADRPAGEPLLRQLCWRDFLHQVTAAFPAIAVEDYRPRGDRWRDDLPEVEAWMTGRTGYPIVDAGMRQLLREGWMHNRARLITASFLVKDLFIDWRIGARHFMRWLVDGDVANNSGNWQWIAGTGNDTRPNRILNPLRQAARFDPDGEYVRRYVPELAGLPGATAHRPWDLDRARRATIDYPEPIVAHDWAAARFLAARRSRASPARP